MTADLIPQSTAVTANKSSTPAGELSSKNTATPALTERPTPALEETTRQTSEHAPAAASILPQLPNRSIPDQQDDHLAQEEQLGITTLSASELREILDEINSALYSYNRALKFELYDKTDDLVVRVLNTKTDEVIRQYPSEEVLARRARLLEGETHFFSTQVS